MNPGGGSGQKKTNGPMVMIESTARCVVHAVGVLIDNEVAGIGTGGGVDDVVEARGLQLHHVARSPVTAEGGPPATRTFTSQRRIVGRRRADHDVVVAAQGVDKQVRLVDEQDVRTGVDADGEVLTPSAPGTAGASCRGR